MSYKKWILGVVLLVIFLMSIYFAINIKLDIYHYWNAKEQSEIPFYSFVRESKFKHISQNLDKYKGFIIGGSKAGAIDPELVSKYEDKEFYNLCVTNGCFEDYKDYVQYIAENTSAEKIILHLGSVEALKYSFSKTPSAITPTKTDDIKESLNMLLLSPKEIIRELTDKSIIHTHKNGAINYTPTYGLVAGMGQEDYIKAYVLSDNAEYLFWRIFYQEKNLEAFNQNLEAMRHIVATCQNHNIELMVIIGPTFVTELYQYEGDVYWSYLRGLVSEVNYWDFSGFNYVNKNPYNFINSSHYNNATADKMIDIIYGKAELDGFGEYITPDNANDYLDRRAQNFFESKNEFDETGTIKLLDKTDKNYIENKY